MRRRSVLLLPIALAFITAACGSDLPKLPGSQAAGAKAEAAGATLDMRLANFRYVLGDGVKTDTDHAKAYTFSTIDLDNVKKVAAAFGVTATIKSDDYGWSAGNTDAPSTKTQRSLYVGQDGTFSVSETSAVSSSASSPACAPDTKECVDVAPTTPTTAPTGSAPSSAQAKKIATDALRAAGVPNLDDMKVTTSGNSDAMTVSFKPEFDGRSVDGFEMSVTVGRDDSITFASGQLGKPNSAGSYELASLKRAVERLNESNGNALDVATDDAAAAAETAIARDLPVTSEDPEGSGSTEPTVITLTAVQVGLMMQNDGAGALWLVPAYLFDSDNGGQVTAPAADDKYIAKPETPTTGKTDGGNTNSGGGSSGNSGSGEGTIEPSPPASTKPTAPPSVGESGCVDVAGDGTADNAPITGSICASSTTVAASTPVSFKITMHDADRGFVSFCDDGVTPEWGDGEGTGTCAACPTTTSAAGAEAARAYEHSFAKPGKYTVKFSLHSGSPCVGVDSHDSKASATLRITVT